MDKVYVPSSATNIIDTWRRFGYVPPSEQEYYQKRWEYYQSLPLQRNQDENITSNFIDYDDFDSDSSDCEVK